MNALPHLPAPLSAALTPPTALQLFQYGLPLLLGYVLYVGIAGRLGPTWPSAPERRPGWFLGAWTGLSVAAVTGTAMHFAYGLPLELARTLFVDAAWALTAALTPGYAIWLAWRSSSRRAVALAADRDVDAHDAFHPRTVPDAFDTADALEELEALERFGTAAPATVVPAHLDAPPARVFGDEGARGDASGNGEASAIDAGESASGTPTGVAAGPGAEAEAEAETETDDAERAAENVLYVPIADAGSADARRALDEERRLREQTERHLQVTRRALYSLDAAAREDEDARADTLIALETELETHVNRSAAAEARATREECERLRAQTDASRLKQEVLRLRSENRRTVEARSRAVATAGKSVAFARRTLQARAVAEDRLREAREALANRQETISSLIRALETEKGRTDERIAARAKQMLLHERQLRERRNLEEVARSVEGKLSTRLVKKVARARPLAST